MSPGATLMLCYAMLCAVCPYLSHPAPTTLLWTYPGIRGQRARPILCLIASSLVSIWLLKKVYVLSTER